MLNENLYIENNWSRIATGKEPPKLIVSVATGNMGVPGNTDR